MRFACWVPKAIYTLSEYVIRFVLHGKSGYNRAPQCYVTLTLSVLCPENKNPSWVMTIVNLTQ